MSFTASSPICAGVFPAKSSWDTCPHKHKHVLRRHIGGDIGASIMIMIIRGKSSREPGELTFFWSIIDGKDSLAPQMDLVSGSSRSHETLGGAFTLVSDEVFFMVL
jgi:hypothetical protein